MLYIHFALNLKTVRGLRQFDRLRLDSGHVHAAVSTEIYIRALCLSNVIKKT